MTSRQREKQSKKKAKRNTTRGRNEHIGEQREMQQSKEGETMMVYLKRTRLRQKESKRPQIAERREREKTTERI